MLILVFTALLLSAHKVVSENNDFNASFLITFKNETWADSFSNSSSEEYNNKTLELKNILVIALKNYTIITSVIISKLSKGSIVATVVIRSKEVLNVSLLNSYLTDLNVALSEISNISTPLSTQSPTLNSTIKNPFINGSSVVTSNLGNSTFSIAQLTTQNTTSVFESNGTLQVLNNTTPFLFVTSPMQTDNSSSTTNSTTSSHKTITNININTNITSEEQSSTLSSLILPITTTTRILKVTESSASTKESITTWMSIMSTTAGSGIPVYAIVVVALVCLLIVIVITFGIIVIICRKQKTSGYGRYHSEFVEMDTRWKYRSPRPSTEET